MEVKIRSWTSRKLCLLLWEFPTKVRNLLGKLPSVEFHCRCCHAHHHGRQGYTEILMRTEGAQACCSNSAWVRLTPKKKKPICVCMCVCFGHVSPLACLHSFSRPPVIFFFVVVVRVMRSTCCYAWLLSTTRHKRVSPVRTSSPSADMCSQVQPFLAQTLTTCDNTNQHKKQQLICLFWHFIHKEKMEGKERRSCCFCWSSGKTEAGFPREGVAAPWCQADAMVTVWEHCVRRIKENAFSTSCHLLSRGAQTGRVEPPQTHNTSQRLPGVGGWLCGQAGAGGQSDVSNWICQPLAVKASSVERL